MPGRPDVVECEDLLVGDDSGAIYYYSVFWPDNAAGHTVLLTKLDAHSQNICGLAWSPDGETFVTGGNDNSALLFYTSDVLDGYVDPKPPMIQHRLASSDDLTADVIEACQNATLNALQSGIVVDESMYISGSHPAMVDFSLNDPAIIRMDISTPPASPDQDNDRMTRMEILSPPANPDQDDERGRQSFRVPRLLPRLPPSPVSPARTIPNLENSLASPGINGRSSVHRKSFFHSAAVKAIAYAPWQATLVATGGGSNDRQIHFYHTESGSTLAVINVFAQVTSLVWSSTKREIVATFGYAQPEHDVRVAVFAWPSCECVVSIPWERKANGEIGRALWAIPYPGGPNSVTLASHERRDVARQHGTSTTEDRATQPRSSIAANMLSSPPQSFRADNNAHRSSLDSNRSEGEAWASRTEEEGSLIIACCDQTVKFFEVWAGKSKGRTRGIGSKAGVLGGSKVLEGWCGGVSVDEVNETDSIR